MRGVETTARCGGGLLPDRGRITEFGLYSRCPCSSPWSALQQVGGLVSRRRRPLVCMRQRRGTEVYF